MRTRSSGTRFDRRALLRGLGGAAIALPWLEATAGRAQAAATGPRRFIVFFEHGGTISATMKGGKKYDGSGVNNGVDGWAARPGDGLVLGPIHQALQPFADSIAVVRGVDNAACAKQSPYNGDHGWANVTALTCANVTKTEAKDGDHYTTDGASIDAVLATRLAQRTPVKFPSINLSIPAHNYGTPFFRAPSQPVEGEYNPLTAFGKLFEGVTTAGQAPDPVAARARALRKSVLDGVGEGLGVFRQRVSAADARSVDAHLDHIRALERRLDAVAPQATCSKPTLTGQDARVDQYSVKIEKSGPAQVDIMIAAMRCGLTNVGTIEIGDFYAKFLDPTFPAAFDIGHSLHHSARDVGKTGPDGAKWQDWYDTMLKNRQWRIQLLARFLDGLASTPEAGGTMLDNTLVLWTSEFSCGADHAVADLPILLAGKAGGRLKTGRQVNFNTRAASDPATREYATTSSLHNLYTSILNMFDYPDTNFGSTGHAWHAGPLAGLG
jgi:hypothetical protein